MAGPRSYEVEFSEQWRRLFGRPPDEVTAAETDFLTRVLPLPAFARVLDVPCGFGRHGVALFDRGYQVVGVDNDPVAVTESEAAGLDARLGDMRDLTRFREFDAVVNMWASFGWFDDETNTAVLRGFAERLRPGGLIVLDVYDGAFFESRQGERDNNGVLDRKWIDGGRLHTELRYADGSRDAFSWQLYSPEELAAASGLELVLSCAGFDEIATPRGEQPRMQVVLSA